MNSSSDPRESALAAAGIAGVVALAFAPVLFGGQSFYHLDTYFEHVPFWHFAAETVARGEWPWWTPNIRAGYPLHANGEASLLYPLTLPLGLALPAHRAVDLFGILHLIALGVFTWRYLREIDVEPEFAFAGAVATALSGRMVASTIWPNAVAASCFLPLLLFGVERCRRQPGRGAAWVAAAVALGLLAGRPQRFVPVLLFGGAYALALAVSERRSGGARRLAWLGGGALIGLAIAAPQALPTLGLVADSIWADGLARGVFEENSLKGRSLAQFFRPSGAASWAEGKLYPGVFVYLGIAIGAVQGFARRGRFGIRTGFFGVSAALCFWLAFAAPGAYAICQALPILESLRSPVRFLYPASLALTLFGVIAWRDVAAASGWSSLLRRAVAGLACAELIVVCWFTAPTAPSMLYEVRPSALSTFSDATPDRAGFPPRFYASGHWIAPQVAADLSPAELSARFGALPLTRDLAMRFGRFASGGYGEPRLAWKDASYRRLARNELDQLGVRRLFVNHRLKSGDYKFDREHGVSFVYENPTALPRALCVSSLLTAPSAERALETAASGGFDPATAALVERRVDAEHGGNCEVRATERTPTRVVLDVDARRPTWLLLFDTWAPGWHASANGATVEVERANGMFRLVSVPAGSSQVVFEYRPPGLVMGTFIAALGLLGWFGLWRFGPRSA
jgi:hypothetical protein